MNTTVIYNTDVTLVYHPPFELIDEIIVYVILVPMAVFGLISNAITIWVINKSSILKSFFNHLIMSLCFSDLISAAISALFLYRRTNGYDNWILGKFVCKLIWGLDYWTSYVTALHIFIFSFIRFISVKKPTTLYLKIKLVDVQVSICATWLICWFVGFLPMMYLMDVTKRDRWSGTPASKWPECSLTDITIVNFRLYTIICYSIFFFFLVFIIILMSIATITTVWSLRMKRSNLTSAQSETEIRRRKKEEQIILQLMLIVGSFLIGYMPRAVYHFISSNNSAATSSLLRRDWWFGSIEYTSLRLSECLNPIFYNLGSGKMRKETKRLLAELWNNLCKSSSPAAGANRSNEEFDLRTVQSSSRELHAPASAFPTGRNVVTSV